MSNNTVHIHNVTHVDVDTEVVGLDRGNRYAVRCLFIHSVDHRGNDEVLRVILYGTTSENNKDMPKVPFQFLAEEVEQ